MNDFILEILKATKNGAETEQALQNNKGYHNKSKEQLISCPKCKTVWEWNQYNRKYAKEESSQYYYVDFPHYGKPQEICPKCKKGRKSNTRVEINYTQE